MQLTKLLLLRFIMVILYVAQYEHQSSVSTVTITPELDCINNYWYTSVTDKYCNLPVFLVLDKLVTFPSLSFLVDRDFVFLSLFEDVL